ncbi:cubilin-like [Gigantopelta aegis]|uniref:cubilin-like n=1 Tax=Gigantopelta aegis TaxID=1735272 RepID=UPI001B88869D|nr:cubilin-like [Gigantopelta aegis]
MDGTAVLVVTVLFTTFSTVWTQCQGPSIYHDDHDVTISSPVYSTPVTGKRHCEWRFQKVKDVIRVEVVSFDLEEGASCDSGLAPHVEVLAVQSSEDGHSAKKTTSAGRWCGKISSATVEVRSDVTVIFRSDNSHDVGSFQIKVSQHDTAHDRFLYCDREEKRPTLTVFPGSPVFIYSPGFPVKYPSLVHCQWDVQANSSDLILVVESISLRIEKQPDCLYDNVSITGVGQVPVVRCGSPYSLFLVSSGSKVHINFTTDLDVEKKGFALKIFATKPYNTSCIAFGSRALDAHYHTPSLLTLPHNKDQFSCSWLIQAAEKDHVVYIETVDWDDYSLKCGEKKGFHVYDGRSNTDIRLVTSCGIKRPFGFLRSTGQHIFIQADLTVSGKTISTGFTMKYFSRHKNDFASHYSVPNSGVSYMWIAELTSRDQRKLIHPWTFAALDDNKCVEAGVNERWLTVIDGTFTPYFNAFDGPVAERMPLGYCSSTELSKAEVSGTGRYLTLVPKNNTANFDRRAWYLSIQVTDKCTGDLTVLDVTEIQYLDYRVSTLPTGLLTCRWKLKTSLSRIKVERISMMQSGSFLIDGHGCEKPYLASYDTEVNDVKEDDDNLIRKWCPGTTSIQGVISSARYMMLVFVADVTADDIPALLFSVKIQPDRSGPCATMTGNKPATDNWQYLSSPGYPYYTYPNNIECTVHLTASSPNHVVKLEIISLDLGEQGGNCNNGDVLKLLDGVPGLVKTLAVLCGSGYSQTTYNSTGGNMLVSFISDRRITYQGFKLLFYQQKSGDGSECDYSLNATRTAKWLTSPKYPLNYPSNSKCTWLIQAPYSTTAGLKHVVKLEVVQFRLESSPESCELAGDFVQIYDGHGPYSKLLATLCSTNNYRGKTYRSSGQYLYIEFKSDRFDSSRGFRMEFSAELLGCSSAVGELTADAWTSYYLSSPNYPDSYPVDSRCTWRIITADPSHVVRITVVESNLEESDDCRYDVVRVYDGEDASSRLLGQWCGRSTPSYTSRGRYVYIVFTSDKSKAGKFRLEYSSVRRGQRPAAAASTDSGIGVIVGGVLGGVIGLLLLTIMCMCLISRTRSSLFSSSSSSSSTRNPTSEPVIVNRHNSTVFVMSPVYVGGGGSDGGHDMMMGAPPPAYPGVTNPAYLTTPDEDPPPSYSSLLSAYHVTRLDSLEAPESYPAAEYLVPVTSGGQRNNGVHGLRRPPAQLARVPETSLNEYAEPSDPTDDIVMMSSSPPPYDLNLPQAPPPPTSRTNLSVSADPPQPPPAYDSPLHPSMTSSSVVPAYEAREAVTPSTAPSSSSAVAPPSYESSQTLASVPPASPTGGGGQSAVSSPRGNSMYENAGPARPRKTHYDMLGPV